MFGDETVRSRSQPHATPVGLCVMALVCITLGGCRREPAIPDATYREAVVAFYTGLAALQTSQDVLAREQLERVMALVPSEPAAWADVGLLLLRQQDLDGAAARLTKAARARTRQSGYSAAAGAYGEPAGQSAGGCAPLEARAGAPARRPEGRICAGAGSGAAGHS